MFGKSTTTSSVAVCSNINSVLRPKLPASATYNKHKKTYQFNDHFQLITKLFVRLQNHSKQTKDALGQD